MLKLAAERFHPRRVVFRLLDIGGDKELPYFPLPTILRHLRNFPKPTSTAPKSRR